MKTIAYLGMDVHKDSISLALASTDSKLITDIGRIKNERKTLLKHMKKLSSQYTIKACYEAGPTGFVTYRWLNKAGYHCDIVASSMIPKRPGEKMKKNDRRDARNLAMLYKNALLTPIHIPNENEEATRNLVRCRGAIREDIRRAKHRILKFLFRLGIVYREGNNWTQRHRCFLSSIELTKKADNITLLHYMTALDENERHLSELDQEIKTLSESVNYKEKVGKLRCLRGIDTLSAMIIISEIVSFNRFQKAGDFMSYLGLIPGEYSSGESLVKSSITKTGNSRVRKTLIEAGWHYQHHPSMSVALKKRQEGQPPEVTAHAWKAQQRLHKKFWRLKYKNNGKIAVTAIARELAGFIWSIMNDNKETDKPSKSDER